jgi:hypothetical protein
VLRLLREDLHPDKTAMRDSFFGESLPAQNTGTDAIIANDSRKTSGNKWQTNWQTQGNVTLNG